MAARRDGDGTGIFQDDDPEAFEAEFVNRMLASAAGLPCLCPVKKCRRRKRCFGPLIGGELPCVRRHKGLAQARFENALKVLGWPNLNEDGTPIKGHGQ